MKLSKRLEEKIKFEALKKLKRAKHNWDFYHTPNAVGWMKKLIKKEGGNEKILVSAIYLHDIGYPNLKKGYSFEDAMKSKEMHAKRGAMLARKILSKIGGFTEKEIQRIAYLVENHDKHTNLESHERVLVFEADGLSKIDWENLTPNFDRKNRIKFLKRYYEKECEFSRWHTKTGRKYLKILLKKAQEYNRTNP